MFFGSVFCFSFMIFRMFEMSDRVLLIVCSCFSRASSILDSSYVGQDCREMKGLLPIFSQSSSVMWGQKGVRSFRKDSRSFLLEGSSMKMSKSSLSLITARLYLKLVMSSVISFIVLFNLLSSLLEDLVGFDDK